MLSTIDRIQGWKSSLGKFELSYGQCNLGDLLHLVSISNELYNSGLLASTYLKIICLKVQRKKGNSSRQQAKLQGSTVVNKNHRKSRGEYVNNNHRKSPGKISIINIEKNAAKFC